MSGLPEPWAFELEAIDLSSVKARALRDRARFEDARNRAALSSDPPRSAEGRAFRVPLGSVAPLEIVFDPVARVAYFGRALTTHVGELAIPRVDPDTAEILDSSEQVDAKVYQAVGHLLEQKKHPTCRACYRTLEALVLQETILPAASGR